MITRRQLLSSSAVAFAAACLTPAVGFAQAVNKKATFRYCLNTSTIRGQKPSLMQQIDIAAKAGYDGVELWIKDVSQYAAEGNSLADLKKYIADKGLAVENAIGFAPWLVDDDAAREAGFAQMKQEMELMAQIGCHRIAAAPAGLTGENPLDLFKAGERYGQMIALGRETGVMPQLEFWGASQAFWHLGQVLMVAAVANDPDARILPDVYHLFRGNSGFDGLKMLNGSLIEVFHMNDYPIQIPREQQKDKDRVYPGDGAAPMSEIMRTLAAMGGTKVLSLELFNETYWQQDMLAVAKTGLQKMQKAVDMVE